MTATETKFLRGVIERMRRRSMTWKYIAWRLDMTPTEARLVLYPEWDRNAKPPRDRRKEGEPPRPNGRPKKDWSKKPKDTRTKAQKSYIPTVALHHYEPSFSPPSEVLFERERRTKLQPRSITAALMGDPLPGLSALDRKSDASMARIQDGN